MSIQENQIIAQYAMLCDKVNEIDNDIKIKKAKIEQEINRIEAYNNIFLPGERNSFDISTTEKNSESIIRIAPILEPAFYSDNYHQQQLPFQIHNNSVKKSNLFEVKFLATQPIKCNISLLDIHTFPNLICVGGDGLLRIYDISYGSVFFNWDITVESCENNITCLTKIPDHDSIGIGFEDGFIRFLNLADSVVTSEFSVSNESLSAIFYSTKQTLFCYSKNGEVSCWKGENNCIQMNTFQGIINAFKDIDDPSTNDIFIISDDSNTYRWDIQNNDFILVEKEKTNDQKNEKFSILTEENQIKIIPLQSEDHSAGLIIDVPNYSLFDKYGSCFCFSTESRFFIYNIIVQNNSDGIEDSNTNKNENPEATETNNNNSSYLNIDNYLIGNVNQSKIQNRPDEDKSSK